jgi:hypothetical protein
MRQRAHSGYISIAAATMMLVTGVNPSYAASAKEISSSARAALNRLYASNPEAKTVG